MEQSYNSYNTRLFSNIDQSIFNLRIYCTPTIIHFNLVILLTFFLRSTTMKILFKIIVTQLLFYSLISICWPHLTQKQQN